MKKLLAVAALAFVASIIASSTARAQQYTCVIINGQKCYIYVLDDGTLDTVCEDGSTGSGTFNSATGPIAPQGPVRTELTPVSVQATIRTQNFGIVTTTLDNRRPSSNSSISSVGDERFPLDVRIRFNATATSSAQPDAVYASRTELEFGTENAQSVNPFRNEELTLSNDVEFYDVNDPDQATVFTLEAGSTSVTLGGDPANDENIR